jgi:RHS repeat-associated protein
MPTIRCSDGTCSGPGVDEPLVWYEGSGTSARHWLYQDERGSVSAVSQANGTDFDVNRYDEYGNPAATNTGRFQYTGQAWIKEANLYYYKARFYSPSIGRFLQTDPAGYAAGLNLYAYVAGDPVNATDPSGENCEDASTGSCYTVRVTANWGSYWGNYWGALNYLSVIGGFSGGTASGGHTPAAYLNWQQGNQPMS